MPDNDYTPINSYQDELNDRPDAKDPLMEELGEHPADELGIPEDKYAEEMNDPEKFSEREDDAREATEDADEDMGDKTKAA